MLGSTGSIGKQALQVAAQFPDYVTIRGLAANRRVDLLRDQIEAFRPAHVAIADLAVQVDPQIEKGPEALIRMATDPETHLVIVAMVGAAGLLPTLAALEAGKRVALANKETLVMAGDLIRDALSHGGELVPIDSEHSAIWQCLQGEMSESIEKVVLTASGGAFRDLSLEALNRVTPKDALRHPTWVMGPKITIDSATLMNKGLEVIEATFLFDLTMDQVEVLMHRESIVHSLAYFNDSSVKAQLGLPDMRLPIQYALGFPERWHNDLSRLDLATLGSLQFGPVDLNRYPALRLAIEAGHMGGTFPAALCAADEVAVELFLGGAIGFTAIPHLVEEALGTHSSCERPTLDDILQTDATVRESTFRLSKEFAPYY